MNEIHPQLTQPQKNLPAKSNLREMEIHTNPVSFLQIYAPMLREFHQDIPALHEATYDLTDEDKAKISNDLAGKLSDMADIAKLLEPGTNYLKEKLAQFQELILQAAQAMKDRGMITDEKLEGIRNAGRVESESSADHSSSSQDAFPGRVPPPW